MLKTVFQKYNGLTYTVPADFVLSSFRRKQIHADKTAALAKSPLRVRRIHS
jgi:hypothetical protein